MGKEEGRAFQSKLLRFSFERFLSCFMFLKVLGDGTGGYLDLEIRPQPVVEVYRAEARGIPKTRDEPFQLGV